MMKISVVIATFGDRDWARRADRAAASLDGQGAHEVIVLHRDHASLAEVRNEAAAQATGDWLCHVDADDELEPGYLDGMRWAWVRGADWSPLLVPAVRRVDKATQIARSGIPQRGMWPRANECVIGTLVRACCFQEVGGFREATNDGTPLGALEDYDLWLRCYDAGAQLVYVEEAVYRAYINPGGRNRDQSPYDAIWADHLARIGQVAAKDRPRETS